MIPVAVCPKTQTDVIAARQRLGCGVDEYGHNQYMCLPNTEKTTLVEFCYDGPMGIEYKGKTFYFWYRFEYKSYKITSSSLR